MSPSSHSSAYSSGKNQMINTLKVMIEDLDLSKEMTFNNSDEDIKNVNAKFSNKIFIVHGQNEAMKQSVARFVLTIKYQPIILHELASNGSTIIEKFTNNSDVSFAIVLLSADDLGIKKDGDLSKGKLRSRQNVIFELGFSWGN